VTQPLWQQMGDHEGYCSARCGDLYQPHGGVYFGFVVLGATLAVGVVFASGLCFGRKMGAAAPIMREAKMEAKMDSMKEFASPKGSTEMQQQVAAGTPMA